MKKEREQRNVSERNVDNEEWNLGRRKKVERN